MGKFEKGHKKVGGRKKGARNLLNKKFLDDLWKSWKQEGENALTLIAKEEPLEYAKLVAAFQPKQLPEDEAKPPHLSIAWRNGPITEIKRIIVQPNRPDDTPSEPQPEPMPSDAKVIDHDANERPRPRLISGPIEYPKIRVV